MSAIPTTFDRLGAKRKEQTPQALARLAVGGLFIALWFVLWVANIPMPVPFLIVLVIEILFFLFYWRLVFVLPNTKSIEVAHYGMLAAEIMFHTTMVYFLGGISWLGVLAYVFGLIFSNTFLDMRKAFIYTAGATLAFSALVILVATGVIPHYVYLEQGAFRHTDPRFVITTLIGAGGVFFSICIWVNWVGRQLRQERDAAVEMQDDLLQARADLQHANEELEERVRDRTGLLELANSALHESERRLRTVVGNAPVVLFALDKEGTFTIAEGKALDDLGIKSETLVGRSSFEMFEGQEGVHEAIRTALSGEQSTAIIGGGAQFEAQITPLRDDSGAITGVIGVAVNVTERQQAAALLAGQSRVLEMIAVGAPLVQVLDTLVDVLEEQSDDLLCGICLVSPDGSKLQPISAGSLPDNFQEGLAGGVPIAPSAGSCGTAAFRKQPVIVSDIATDPLWKEFRVLALENGLRACWSTPVFSSDGNVLGTFAIYYREPRDPDPQTSALVEVATRIAGIAIERAQAETALRESESKFRAMAETGSAATFIFQGPKMRYVNSAAERITNYNRDELLQMNFWDIIHPEFRELVKERGMARQRGEDVPGGYEVKILTKDGLERWIDFTAGTVDFDGSPAILGTAFDITERKQAEEALQEAANHDSLTGLLNRRAGLAAIEERLELAKNGSGRFAVFVLDLDKFKAINDSFSHETGDAALVQFSEVMVNLVGGRGVVCRMGGDEFQIGLDDTGSEEAFQFARQLQNALRWKLEHSDAQLRPQFTVSIGIACYPDEGASTLVLGRRADRAMYAAKVAGANTSRAWYQLDSQAA